MANEFISCMLITKDSKDVIDFYKAVFKGWTLAGPSDPRGHVTIDNGPGKGGIILNQKFDAEPLAWLPCVEVKDIDATINDVLTAHGTKVLGKEPMPDDSGFYAIIADPRGAKIAIRQLK